jgi:hypothetical protein
MRSRREFIVEASAITATLAACGRSESTPNHKATSDTTPPATTAAQGRRQPVGGGMIFEMRADVPGEFVFVNHAFGHGQKGAIGVLVVEE